MAAGRTLAGREDRRGSLRRHFGRMGGAVLAVWALAGCGQSMQTPLPDLSAKADPDGRAPMSRAEQKQAIDNLIAKRDAMKDAQPK